MNPSFFLRISIAVCFVPVAFKKVAERIRQVFQAKYYPIGCGDFPGNPCGPELDIPRCGFTFATGHVSNGRVGNTQRRFTVRTSKL